MPLSSTTYTAPARPRWGLIGFACLFLLGLLAVWWTTRPKPTAEDRIRAAFAQAQRAAEHGDITGATDILSPDFRAGDLTRQKVRLILFQARRGNPSGTYDVQITEPRILPGPNNDPQQRLVITRISVVDPASRASLWSTGQSSITLLMREETRKVWLVFPVRVWRVVGAPGLPAGLGDL